MFFQRVILSVVALLIFIVNPVVADTVTVQLEYRTDTLSWKLFALINDTGSGNSGDNGLAALRALIDNVDFGTNGEAVNLATGIGAIDPIDPGGDNERPAVLQTAGGTLDIIYGQDISVPGSVVGGVGVGSRSLIVDGTFASAGTPPAFGDDDRGFGTDGNFLNIAAPGPFGAALPWNSVILSVLDVTPSVPGDYNNNGIVDTADYTVWRNKSGQVATLTNENPNAATMGVVDQEDYDFWKSRFGATSGSGSTLGQANTGTVPEPSALFLLFAFAGLTACCRWRS